MRLASLPGPQVSTSIGLNRRLSSLLQYLECVKVVYVTVCCQTTFAHLLPSKSVSWGLVASLGLQTPLLLLMSSTLAQLNVLCAQLTAWTLCLGLRG